MKHARPHTHDLSSPYRTRVDKEGEIEVLVNPIAGEWIRRYARLTRRVEASPLHTRDMKARTTAEQLCYRPYLRLFESSDMRQEDLVISLENAHVAEAKDLEMILEVSQGSEDTLRDRLGLSHIPSLDHEHIFHRGTTKHDSLQDNEHE